MTGNFINIASERAYPTPYQNSSLLPMLLLTLATQKHSPNTKNYFQPEYDFIVVGAGAAGSVVASRLSEKNCVNVLLLEAGKPPPLLTEVPALARTFVNTDIDWQYFTEPQKHMGTGLEGRRLTWPSGKTLGGSSVLDAMLYIRGNHRDYDNWELNGARGWSWRDVFPYVLKLEDNDDPDILSNGFHSIGGPVTAVRPPYHPDLQKAVYDTAESLGYSVVDSNGASQIGFNDYQAHIRKGQRCSSAKSYLVPSENRTNLDIVPEAFVTKVLMNGNRAEGVQFDFRGRRFQVKARKEVLMAAGAINTAQLLMLSGIGPREILQMFNIPVIADLPVGKNLQDHIAAIMNFEVTSSIPSFFNKLTNPENIQKYIDERTGPLASTEGGFGQAFLPNTPLAAASSLSDHELYFVEGFPLVAKTQFGIAKSVYDQVYGPYENKTNFWCLSSNLHPKSRGYVSIRSANPYEPPVIDPNYLEHQEDVIDIVSGMKTCMKIVNSDPVQRYGVKPFDTLIPGCEELISDEDKYLECQARSIVFTLSHQVGTTKMGDPRDPTTVVDPELRVKGIRGLRVVDASVMPTVPSGNTYVPVLMVAEKASDIIKEDIVCQRPSNCGMKPWDHL